MSDAMFTANGFFCDENSRLSFRNFTLRRNNLVASKRNEFSALNSGFFAQMSLRSKLHNSNHEHPSGFAP